MSKLSVLVVGGGGREHTLVWKIARSPQVEKTYCAPGNAGIARIAECVPTKAEDIDGLLALAKAKKIDLTVVGPEAPLAAGIVDRFEQEGLRIFGPSRKAAEIESSKVFARKIMAKYDIPTAFGETFEDPDAAKAYIQMRGVPMVVKADGLAAGKGVLVCDTVEQSLAAVNLIMVKKTFGGSGSRVVVEERLEGEETSILAFTDGETILPMLSSQDHKSIYDGDKGPNTGGMGAYAPAPLIDEHLARQAVERVLVPAVQGMAKEGRKYVGVLYAGLMVVSTELRVLEFNVRFGDPETQAILPLLENDLVEVLLACIDGKLSKVELGWKDGAAVCVVIASGGYPVSYEKGKVIRGLEDAERTDGVIIFHAGTASKDGEIVTAGGRVLGVTGLGSNIPEAIDSAYAGVKKIEFEGAQHRGDIGAKALRRLMPR